MTATHITAAQLKTLMIGPEWVDPLNKTFDLFDICTPERVGAFLGQAMHETSNLTLLVENLNYHMDALMRVWPTRFTNLDMAAQYHRQPEKIANLVYAGRMGNGDTASGDGWKYRGRGIFQLTGKANYSKAGQALGMDLVGSPDLVAEPLAAALTAGWYWRDNRLNELADARDTAAISRVVNLGNSARKQEGRIPHGASDRLGRTQMALAVLKHGPSDTMQA